MLQYKAHLCDKEDKNKIKVNKCASRKYIKLKVKVSLGPAGTRG